MEVHWNIEQLSPFGVVVTAVHAGSDLHSCPTEKIVRLIDDCHVVVFRRFARLEGDALPEFCERLGTLAEFDFGYVNELQSAPDAKNYLYTNRSVPFHWDGAFVGRVPHYIFFHCDLAPLPDAGGETFFTDTTLMLKHADAATRQKWDQIEITYSTDKIVHYGGEFSARMISELEDGREVIRFAEPVTDLNPVELKIDGLDNADRDSFLADMNRRLHDDRVCYRHRWNDGDIVIADNFTLLHGRSAFHADSPRSIRRVNIL